jgi:hypothetical protein
MEKNLDQSNNTGGTSGKKSLSVSQLNPVFSYPCRGGGDIYVYLFKTETGKFAVATFDDGSGEYAWGIKTLTTNVGCEAEELVGEAERRWGGLPNPFSQFLKRKKAMKSLTKIFSEFFESGD